MAHNRIRADAPSERSHVNHNELSGNGGISKCGEDGRRQRVDGGERRLVIRHRVENMRGHTYFVKDSVHVINCAHREAVLMIDGWHCPWFHGGGCSSFHRFAGLGPQIIHSCLVFRNAANRSWRKYAVTQMEAGSSD